MVPKKRWLQSERELCLERQKDIKLQGKDREQEAGEAIREQT